jgi:hypothetical protein
MEKRYEKIKTQLEHYMMEGYKAKKMRKLFGMKPVKKDAARIFNDWCEEIYGKGTKYTEKRRELITQKIKRLIGFGHISAKQLEPFFEELNQKQIEYFIQTKMQGLNTGKIRLFLQPWAKQLIKKGYSIDQILVTIGYEETGKIGMYKFKDNPFAKSKKRIIKDLFGEDFAPSKRN